MNTIKSGKFLLELRKEKGLSQKEVADILEVSDKTISKWECGEGFPSIDYLVKLSSFYEITIDEIVKGERKEAIKTIPQESVMSNKENKQIPLLSIISLAIGVLALFVYILVMYAGHSLAGSAITLLFFSLIEAPLTFFAIKNEDNKINLGLHSSNFLLTAFSLYLSLYSCGALIITSQSMVNIYINGVGLLIILANALPFLGLLGYSLYKNIKINRSYKDMLLKNYNKYIDVLLFSISLSGLLSFFVEHVTISNNNPFIFTVISLVVLIVILIVDFVLKKEIPFLIPSILMVIGLTLLFINMSEFHLFSLNALGVFSLVAFVGYIFVFLSRRKSKKEQSVNEN